MSSMQASNPTIDTFNEMFAKNMRFDGRKLLDFRDLEISYDVSNKAEGAARVKLGKTEVIAGIKLGVDAPYPDSPEKGNLIVSGDLLPIASPRFESGPPKFQAIELPRLVDRAIRESGMIDMKKLCIIPKEKVWTLFIDIYPINDDGNLIDVATIACIAALKAAYMPELTEDNRPDYKHPSKNRIPLSEETYPFSVTFFKLGNSIFIDPTREEEESSEARVTYGISKWNKDYMINSCQKSGELTFTKQELEMIMDLLPKKYDELNEKVKKHLPR